MNLVFRMLYTLVISLWQGDAPITASFKLRMRTWPNDLDTNFHMNNGRYLTLMDLGRTQMMIRSGLFWKIIKEKWMPVVGEAHIKFKKSLAPFESFTLETKVHSWDEKWVYMEQSFYNSKGQLAASGYVKALIKGPKGKIPTAELLNHLQHSGVSPQDPPSFFAEAK